MELKEYLRILRKNLKTFWFVVFVITAIGFIYFLFRPTSYSTSITINITRSGKQETENYKYDDFYRLQADEKFVETVVEWLKAPRTVADIYQEANLDIRVLSLKKLSKIIKAEKLSAQIIGVSFTTKNEEIAKDVSMAINKVLTSNISALNQNQQENTWFEIVAHKPITLRDNYSLLVIGITSLIFGIFLAFWTVLIIHYLK